MPDVAVHASFGLDVLRSLEEPVRSRIQADPYRMALFGPDPWFVYPSGHRGRRMHTDSTGAFLCALARRARDGKSTGATFSYLAGFICHYALDSAAHPYIIRRTTEEFPQPGAHRAFEHTLDLRELDRLGMRHGPHPITSSLLPALRLPGEMRADLDAALQETYGWKNGFRAMRWLYPLFRRCYALMENPRSLVARLARVTGKYKLRSLAYSESWFDAVDVENREHRVWAHSHDDTLPSRQSFADLRAFALEEAVRMIIACYRYVFLRDLDTPALKTALGSLSYLSGFPERDARNWAVPSMLPSPEVKKEV